VDVPLTFGYEENSSAPNSIPVFKDTPHFVIPYLFLRTSALGSISLYIRPRNHLNFIIRRITALILIYGRVIKSITYYNKLKLY
jgi:hypothetical protein